MLDLIVSTYTWRISMLKTMVQMTVLKSTFYLSFVIRRNLNHGSEDKPGLVSTGLNQGLFSFCNKAFRVLKDNGLY